MSRWSQASLVIFATAAVATGWAITHPPPPGPGDHEPWMVHQVEPGHSVDFVITPQVERIKVVSHTLAPPEAARLPIQWLEYALDLEWLDRTGQPIASDRVVEQSRPSWYPGDEGLFRGVYLPGDPQPVTDGRATVLPARMAGLQGGTLRVWAPEDGPPLLLRAHGKTRLSGLEAEQRAMGATERAREGYLLRLGLPDWGLLHRGERRALATTAWTSLRPGAQSGGEARWLMHSEVEVGPTEQRTAGLVLEPGRAAAVDLVGPVVVHLSGQGLGELEMDAVYAMPGEGEGVVVSSDGRVELSREGPVSLRLSNPTPSDLGPVHLGLDDASPERVHGWTAVASSADLFPDQARHTVLAGPEWRYLATWRIGPERVLVLEASWLEHGAPIQLEVRSVLRGPEDHAPRHLGLEAWGSGAEPRRSSVEIPSVPAPMEYLLPGRDWVSEPETLYLLRDAGVRKVVLHSTDEMLVMARSRGAPRGDPSLYPLPEGATTRVRYRRDPPTVWHALLPEGGATSARIAANVRLEPKTTTDLTAHLEHLPWTSLTPGASARARARTWLVPLEEGAAPGVHYCRLGPGPDTPLAWDEEAAAHLDHLLEGVLWSEDLGATWSATLDGEPWRGGRIRQRVTRVRATHQATASTARLDAPEGSTLWLRTDGMPGPGCADARRPFALVPVEPGGSVSWEVLHGTAAARVLVGGAAASPAVLMVTVDEGSPDRLVGLHPSYTEGNRRWELASRVDQHTWPVDDPDLGQVPLSSRALVLGTDLRPGWHTITATNTGDTRVYLRAAVQGARGVKPADTASLLRGGAP